MKYVGTICQRCTHTNRRVARYCGQCGYALVFPPGISFGHAGRYRIECILGQGGFGQAYLARDTHLARSCVVKRLTLAPDQDPAERMFFVKSFEREAQLLVDLNTPGHPHIPDIYEYLPEKQALVMKYVQGESLEHILNHRVDGLPEKEALQYARNVCWALVYMHSRIPEPVLHRDIKPANILLDAEGRVWVIDFGLSKGISPQITREDQGVTLTAGTRGYTPPEQWYGQAEPRSDVYALAATLHTLLTNYRPPPDVLFQLMHGDEYALPSVRQLRPDLRSDVEALIKRAMALDVNTRPTARELLSELDAILQQLDIPAPPEPVHPPDTTHLVGRDVERAYCQEYLTTCQQLILTGPAGVGKSSLAATVVISRRQSEKIFWYTCQRGKGILDLLWQLAAFLAHNGQYEGWYQLHRLAQSDNQDSGIDGLEQYLISMLLGHTYLLCLDDFHLVEDDLSMNTFVQRLYREAQASNVHLLVVTRNAPAFAQLRDIVCVSGLSLIDTQHLLRHNGLDLSESLLSALHLRTGGNAQLLTLAIDILHQAPDSAEVINRLPEYDEIERFLLYEVDAGLSDDERAVMQAVALFEGQSGTRRAIEAIGGNQSVQRLLHGLARRHLLLTIGDGGAKREYKQHAIVQAFYYDMISLAEQRTLHQRAAVYYEIEAQDTLRAAHHFERARLFQQAAELATAHLWEFINRGQGEAVRELLSRFTETQVQPRQWVIITLALGRLCMLHGETCLAREHYQQGLSALKPLPDSSEVRTLRSRACRSIGASLEHESPQEALDWLQQASQVLAGANDFEEALVRRRIGSIFIAIGDHKSALQELTSSLHLFPPDFGYGRAQHLLNLGIVYCSLGDISRGKDYYLQALRIYEQTHNHWGIIGVRQNIGIELEIAGEWDAAAQEYEHALEAAQTLGAIGEQIISKLTLGILHTNRGDFQQARDYLLSCLELAQSCNDHEDIICAQSSLADLYMRQNDIDSAEPLLRTAEALSYQFNIKSQLPEIYRGWAHIHLVRSQSYRAQDAARRALSTAEDLGSDIEKGVGLRVLGMTLAAAGQQSSALAIFDQSLALLQQRDPYEAARTQVQWGCVLLTAKQDKLALPLLHKAQETFTHLGALVDAATVKSILQR